VDHLRGRPRKIPFFDVLIDMGRIPVPTEILDTRGSFLKHPERRRLNEPQEIRPLGNAPRCLTAEKKKLWGENCPQSAARRRQGFRPPRF